MRAPEAQIEQARELAGLIRRSPLELEGFALLIDHLVEICEESAAELEAAWQESAAGQPWEDLAKILSKASAQIQKKIEPASRRKSERWRP